MMLANISGHRQNDNAEKLKSIPYFSSTSTSTDEWCSLYTLYIFNVFIHFKKIRSKNECYASDRFDDFIFFVFLYHFNSNVLALELEWYQADAKRVNISIKGERCVMRRPQYLSSIGQNDEEILAEFNSQSCKIEKPNKLSFIFYASIWELNKED